MEYGLIKMLTRTLMSHAMGLEGLRDDILKRFQEMLCKTGKEVISQKELEQQLEAMIVWKFREVYHDLYEIARRRGK
jgi:hypothetical protein